MNLKITIKKGDITKEHVDIIVNAANTTLLGGGGVDGAIHKAAGKELLEECKKIGGCNTGEAVITKGYNLPCKYVVHTPGPDYRRMNKTEDERIQARKLLASSYYNSLMLAKSVNAESVAFPSISTGIYGFPLEEGANIAINTIKQFGIDKLDIGDIGSDMIVEMVLFDDITYSTYIEAVKKYLC